VALGVALSTTGTIELPKPRLLYGPLVGDLTASAAVVWCRVEGLTQVTCEVRAVNAEAGGLEELVFTSAQRTRPEQSCAAKFGIRGLHPATDYSISIPELSQRPLRHFHTMSAPTGPAEPLRLAFTGDVGGQHIGRDLEQGFAGFPVIAARRPDVFIGLGDMIYADKYVRSVGPLGNRQVPLSNSLLLGRRDYWRHWNYLHQDGGFAALLHQASYVQTWDDHECCSDFGPGEDGGLLELARDALFEWNPVLGTADEPQRLYRALRWGAHCELFMLDSRSYRDPMAQIDDGPKPKTMLGTAQREWLLQALADSDAAWKIIVSSVPLACPTGNKSHGYGGWTDNGTRTGYERELLELLRDIQRMGIRRPVFLTADVHHAEVLELAPFADDPGFRPLEITVGPMNAKLFGRLEVELDPNLHPRSLFYLSPEPPPTSLAAAKQLWNFGVIDIDADAAFRLEIVTVEGKTVYHLDLAPCLRGGVRVGNKPR
jgi:alkaline phosphatase D